MRIAKCLVCKVELPENQTDPEFHVATYDMDEPDTCLCSACVENMVVGAAFLGMNVGDKICIERTKDKCFRVSGHAANLPSSAFGKTGETPGEALANTGLLMVR